MPTAELNVETISPGNDEALPFVVTFPSGFVPEVSSEGKGASSVGRKLAVTAYKAVDTRHLTQYTLSGSASNVNFFGTTKVTDSFVKNPCQYVLGVWNKKEKVMKLVPITGGKILRMETRVPGVSYDTGLREEDKDAEKEENGKTEEENIQRRRTLTEEFGSKQKKRKVEAYKKGILTDDNIAAADNVKLLLKKASEAGEDAKPQQQEKVEVKEEVTPAKKPGKPKTPTSKTKRTGKSSKAD